MNKTTQNKSIEVRQEGETNYFSTPNTSLDTKRQVQNYDSFDISNESYKKSAAKIVIRKYIIK